MMPGRESGSAAKHVDEFCWTVQLCAALTKAGSLNPRDMGLGFGDVAMGRRRKLKQIGGKEARKGSYSIVFCDSFLCR